jgi:hypothetical protein
MTQIKICPDCNTEYFPHIENCADCGVVLLTPEELKGVQEEKKKCIEKIVDSAVAVREGDLKWLDELYHVLIDSGIPCTVNADTGCKKGCCGNPYRLLVSSGEAEQATLKIEEYCRKVHPELESSEKMLSQGKCPACASPVESGSIECPECGLTLLIIEQ